MLWAMLVSYSAILTSTYNFRVVLVYLQKKKKMQIRIYVFFFLGIWCTCQMSASYIFSLSSLSWSFEYSKFIKKPKDHFICIPCICFWLLCLGVIALEYNIITVTFILVSQMSFVQIIEQYQFFFRIILCSLLAFYVLFIPWISWICLFRYHHFL